MKKRQDTTLVDCKPTTATAGAGGGKYVEKYKYKMQNNE